MGDVGVWPRRWRPRAVPAPSRVRLLLLRRSLPSGAGDSKGGVFCPFAFREVGSGGPADGRANDRLLPCFPMVLIASHTSGCLERVPLPPPLFLLLLPSGGVLPVRRLDPATSASHVPPPPPRLLLDLFFLHFVFRGGGEWERRKKGCNANGPARVAPTPSFGVAPLGGGEKRGRRPLGEE